MGIIRSLDALDPSFRPLALELTQRLALAGIHYRIDETLRTQDVQDAYYLQSRAPLAEVNAARSAAGLYLISESENKTMVTKRNLGERDNTVTLAVTNSKKLEVGKSPISTT